MHNNPAHNKSRHIPSNHPYGIPCTATHTPQPRRPFRPLKEKLSGTTGRTTRKRQPENRIIKKGKKYNKVAFRQSKKDDLIIH